MEDDKRGSEHQNKEQKKILAGNLAEQFAVRHNKRRPAAIGGREGAYSVCLWFFLFGGRKRMAQRAVDALPAGEQ